MVWTHNGTWIPDHLRYPEGWVDQLDWYTYCDTFHIPWEAARLLPWWAMEEMDQYQRDKYYRHTSRETLVEENTWNVSTHMINVSNPVMRLFDKLIYCFVSCSSVDLIYNTEELKSTYGFPISAIQLCNIIQPIGR